jgi:hypothetical protein
MTDGIFRLAYISRNGGLNDPSELNDLLASARRNNATMDVTGALLFSRDCFAQVLEGPMVNVSQVFERIQLDERHSEVVVLMAEQAAGRRFPDWAMAYAGEDAAARERFSAMSFEALRERAVSGGEILAMLDGAVHRAPPVT